MTPESQHYEHCICALRQSPLFSQVEEKLLQDMMRMFHHETAHRQDTDISVDGNNHRFHLIVSGRVKISVYHSETGREHILFLLGPGDGFDLISLLDGEPHDVNVTALDDMEFLTTPLSQAREWICLHPDFNQAILPYVGRQMRILADQVEDLSLYDTESRLARLILRHLATSSPPHELHLINDLSQEALASMIGSVRIVVSRHMHSWKQEKVVSGGRGRWSMNDLGALLEKAEKKFLS